MGVELTAANIQVNVNIDQLQQDLLSIKAPNNPRPLVVNTNKKVSFPCMDRLVQLVNFNTLTQEKIVQEFQIFVQSRGQLCYDPPSLALIKKRVKQICTYETLPGKAS